MVDKSQQFIDEYDKYLETHLYTVGLIYPIIPDPDEESLQEVITVIDAELAKIS